MGYEMNRKGKTPGKLRVMDALKDQSKGYKQLWLETGLRGNLLSKYLKVLQREGGVERDIETRRYRLTQKGLGLSSGLSSANFLEQNPPSLFTLHLGIEGTPVEGISVGPMIVDHPFSASLSYDREIGAVAEIFRERMNDAALLLVSEIACLAVRKRLLPKPSSGKVDVRRIPRRRWREIFKRLCPEGHELTYLERIDLRDLLRVLTHPKGLEAASSLTVEVSPIAKTKRD